MLLRVLEEKKERVKLNVVDFARSVSALPFQIRA